jgi:hypothetical protein
MTDLIERLRDAGASQNGNWSIYDDSADALEAKDREIERLRGLLSRARNSVVADARAAYNTDLPLTASNLNALVARIDAALGETK